MKGNDGFYLVLPEASREGNITFDQVKLELAETELRQERAKAKAKAEADAGAGQGQGRQGQDAEGPVPGARRRRAPGAETVPRAEETGLFARRGTIVEGLGTAPELAKAAFSLKPSRAVRRALRGRRQLRRRQAQGAQAADLAEFEKKKAELMQPGGHGPGRGGPGRVDAAPLRRGQGGQADPA